MRINVDSPLIHTLSTICDVVVNTFLFLLCCLPVVTIGAALTAMQATMMSIAADNCAGVLSRFFGSFRENFRLATLIWLPLAAVGAVVAVEIWGCWLTEQNSSMVLAVMRGLSLFSAALYGAVVSFVFPGIGRYHVTWKQALGNALVWVTKKPLITLGLLMILCAMAFVCYLVWFLAFPALALGLYLQARLLNRAFGFAAAPVHQEEEIRYE